MLSVVRHGYTNRTDRQGNFVRKAYAGPDAELRQTTEHHALDALRGQFPVPLVTATGAGWLETRLVDGIHGQDLIDAGHVAAVLDWEFSGVGEAITDIAWCEWIVRMHHPAAVAELSAFFAAYGAKPPWRLRQDAMARRCRWLEDFTNRWDPNGSAVALWQQRTRTVESWHE
jgi:hypothetical protein